MNSKADNSDPKGESPPSDKLRHRSGPGGSPAFAFVIPVYNHAETIESVVRGALQYGFPVIVVDDGSTDPPPSSLEAMEGLTLLRHETNRGKGAALMTGFAAASKAADTAITLDADGQHDPADASVLIDAAQGPGRPFVVGARQGMDNPEIPWTSRFGRKFSNFWVRLSGGPRITDSQCGFRVYPLPEILKMKPMARRYQFEVEVLALCGWKKIPVREVPISVVYAPGSERISHFRPFVDFWRNAFTFTRLIACRILLPSSWRARL